jgi:membrane protease YdiL (CAAX protease family)
MTPVRRTALALGLVLAAYVAFRVIGGPVELEGVAKICLWVSPCLLILALTGPGLPRYEIRELGLAASPAMGYGFGLLAALPTLAALPFMKPAPLGVVAFVNGVLLGPFAEEVLFRGFLMRQLIAAGWRPLLAVVASALAFGLAHLSNGAAAVAMTAGGGLLLGWIVLEWGSLWPGIGLHTFMNLSWQIFAVNDGTAGSQAGAAVTGSSVANTARVATIVIAIALTLLRSRARARTQKHVIHSFTHSPFTH